jgi:hypothetical protein
MPYQITLPDGSIGMIDDSVPKDRAMEAAEAAYPDAFPGIGEQLLGAPGELAKGFARGFVDPVSGLLSTGYTGLRAAGMELDPFAETAVGKGLAGVQEYLAPDYGTVSQFAGALGGLGSFLVPGAALAKGLGRTATLGGMATGLGAEEARSRVEQARAEGIEVTPGQEFTSQLGGSVIGLTELAPIERLTGPLQAVLRGVKKSDADMIAPGLFNSAKRMVETGGIEGLQEGMANVAQDLLAKGVYNPNLEVGDSALGDAAMGASVGAFAQGAIELVTKGRRRQLYDTLKAEEDAKARIAEAEKARLAEETARKQTLTNFGVEGQPLLLAAPQGQVTPSRQEKSSLDQYGVEDKDLFEPYGTFTRDELDKDVVKELDKRRKEAGRPKTETFTLQDIADTGVYRGELNRLIAQRSGYTGELKFKPSEVVGLAEQKNIDTSTQGFSDFVGRVTGKKPLPEKTGLGALQGLNDVEIFAVREAINKLPTYEQKKILPTGKAAKIFDDKQSTKTLTSIKKTLGEDLGGEGLGETSILQEIGDYSGLEDVNDQKSLLEKYILDGELERVSTPAVAVLDANGNQVSVIKGSTQAERLQAQKKAQEIGGTIKDTSINQIRTPDPVNRLIGGFDIRQGTFEDTLIDGYDITTETGEVISKTKSLTDAENRVNRATELRKQRQLQLLDAKQKIQENIAKSEQAMADLEALGKKDSEDFKKIQNSMAAQERNLAKVEQNLIEFGKKVAFKSRYKQQKRTGFTLFEGNKPVGTYNSRQEALEASVVSQPTDRLEAMLEAFPTLSASAKPGMDRADIKKLQQVAASELASRKGEIPSGVGITVEGDITAAEERLALQGIFSPKIKERVNELDKKLRAALDKLGLKDVRLNIVGAIKGELGDADGVYAARLIKIALDAENPMRVLRHEGIHALKELGAFTPDQWRVLENKAKSEWMAKYNIADPKRYGSLSPEIQLEEAIAEAFADFSQTKPPAGLIGNVFSRIKSFFAALDNGFKGLGFQTADDVFGRVERGELLPSMGERAAEVEGLQAQRVTAETSEPVQDRTGAKLPTKPVSTRPVTESVPQLPPLPQAKPDEPSMPISRRSQSKGSVSAVPMSLLTTPEALQRTGDVLSVLDKSDPNESLRALNLAAERGGLAEWEARAIAFGRAEGAPGSERYSLKRVPPSKVVSSVIEDLGLTDAEVAATSLGLQTGKGGTNAFKQQDVGGIRDIVDFLENRYRNSGLPNLDLTQEADRDLLSKLLSAEVLSAIRSGGANIQWYDKVIDQMLGMASLKYPELRTDPNAQAAFRIAISVSSQGQNVEDNLKFSERVYEQFSQNAERGRPRFPEIGTGESMKAMQNNFRIANRMIDKMGMDDFRKFLETPFTVQELNSVGMKITGELADEQVLGSSVFGPKIGFGFYSNLSGNFEPVTMDMWFMRTIGRLIGKLKEFDPAKYAKQVQRFRGSFALSGDNGIYSNEFSQEEINQAIVDEQAMIDLARKVKSLHEKDFKKNRDLFDSGQREKTDFVKSSENIIKSLDSPKDAPSTGAERRLLRDVVRRMRQRIADVTGQDIPPASLQAIAWYPEQELYKALGAKLRVTSQNYANSMRKLLEGEGFDGDRISESAKLGSRRTRRADAGEVAAGTRPTGRRPSRTLSPEEREAFLEQGREEVFFVRERKEPKAQKIIFDIAPNPDDVELTRQWNALSVDQKQRISQEILDTVLPRAMQSLGIDGYIANQIGSYENDTNPSFGLFVKKGTTEQIQELAKMLGYALRQKEMVVASPKEAKGLSKNGAIRIEVGDINLEEADRIYQSLRDIRVNGKQILDGQTTVHGNMVLLNFSNLKIDKFAKTIHDHLRGDYNIVIDDVYSKLINQTEYNYDDPKSDPRGNRGVLRERSRTLRAEATNLFDKRLEDARRGRFSLRGDGRGRDQGRSLTPLKGTPVIQGATGPDPRLVRVAEKYAKDNNIPYTRQGEYVEIDPEFARSLAAAYEAMPHEPKNKKVKEAFADLAKQVRQQYDALTDSGYRFTFFDSKSDPYGGNPWNAMRDLRANKRMAVYGTYDGYGTEGITGAAIENNPMLQDTGLRWADQSGVRHPVTVNDLFRAVHDAFGHGLEGAGFRSRGEENAFQAHARLFTGPALGALTSETRGQNSWMNFGPYGKTNKTAKLEDSVFAKQKAGLMPEWTWTQRIAPDQKYSLRTTDTPEFKQWFGRSTIVDAEGRPRVMYHGTARDITEFKAKQAGAIFVTEDPRFAEDFSYMSEMWMIDHADQFLSEQEIKKAIAAGVAKMAQGIPKQDQIRMLTQILQFPIDSVVRDPDATEIRNEIAKRLPSKPNILPVYVRAERPFDFENQEHLDDLRSMPGVAVHYQRIRRGEWSSIEEPEVQEAIRDLGFDGFYVKEGGKKNLAVYRPDQLKSVTGNIGTYGQREPTEAEAAQFGMTKEEASAAQKRGDLRYSLRSKTPPPQNIQRFFDQAERLETTPDISDLRDAWIGGVSDSGLNEAAYYINDVPGGKDYTKNVQKLAKQMLGNRIKGFRLMSTEELENIRAGDLSYYAAFTLDPNTALSFANFVQNRKIAPKNLVVVEADINPGDIHMIGKDAESEVVVDMFKLGDQKVQEFAQPVRYSLRQTNTPAFKQWFGDSKVVDKKGDPLVVYHGTDKTFDAFNLRKRGSRVGFQDDGFYFSDSPGTATTYATMDVYSGALGKKKDAYLEPTDFFKRFLSRLGLVESAPQVVPAFLSIKNPYKTTGARMPGRRELIKQGYDGIQYTQYDGTTHWVAFEPTQIKSSIGNIGTFDPENPDIRYSLRQQAGQTLGQSYLDTVQRTTTPRVEKGFKDRISEAMSATPFAKFRQMFINKYERIEYYSRELAKKFGDSSLLLADQSAIAAALMSDRAAGVAAESFKSGIPVYAKGYTYVDNMGGKVKGLMEILMPLAQKQDPFVYQMFQDYAARRRGVRLDAQGKVTPFSRQELAQIPAIEKQFPEFKQVFEDYQRYNEGLVRYMRDTGVIDAKAAQEWMRYGDYIPFYRQLDGERTVGPSIFSAISGVKAPKKLKGGDAPLGEFLETVVRNSRAAIEAGMRNVAANRVVTNFQRLNSPTAGGKLVERTTEKERDFPDVVTVRENGKDAYYKVADPLLVQSLQALNIPQIPGLDILAKPAEFLREMVTRDPAFIGASVLRESLSAWITTGQKLTPVATGVNQFVKILSNASPTVQALRRAGIGSGYEFKGDVQATAGVFGDQLKRMAGEMTTAQKAVMPLRAMWDGLDKASTAADLSTRAAVFERVLEETGNEAEAIYQAMEVINFSRKGSSPIIQIFAAIIPFLNARIQGLDLLYRAGFGRLASSTAVAQQKAFMLRSLALFGTTAMYYALVQDEEEWQRADQETRDNYWIIGGFKFPIPFELGVMFKVIPERIMAYTMGDDTGEQVRESIARQVMGTLSFNPIPQAVLPLIEASSNYSFFLQRDIVGMGKKDLAPEFQISEGTSQIAIQLGQTLGISPMKIDYIIRGYTGAMGTYAITTMDSIIRSEDDATKATWRLDQIPVLKRFMISDLGAGTVNEYYDLREKLDEVVRTSNQLERTGNIEALTEYLKENGQVLGMKDYIRDLDKDMKSLRESRLAINISRMEPDQKRQSLDALRKAEIALTERINLLRKNMGV